jgi:hypothetical protein
LLLGVTIGSSKKERGPYMITRLKNHLLHYFLKQTNFYVKEEKLELTEEEKLFLLKQVVHRLREVIVSAKQKEKSL